MNWRSLRAGAIAGPLAQTILVAAAMGLVAVVASALLMWSIIQLDHGQLRTSVRQAFQDETLVAKSGPLFDLRRGDYLFNDCLILQTLLLGRDDWRHSVIDATIYLSDDPCRVLQEEVTDQTPMLPTYQYARYLFSARVASAPLIGLFGVDRAKQVLKWAVYVTLLLAALACLRGLASAPASSTPTKTLYMTGLLCVVTMLGLYRLEYYAQTFAHGYSELVIAAFLLHSVTSAYGRRLAGTPTAAIVLGVLTGCFELLSGPILVAVGMAVLLDYGAAPTRKHPYRRAMLVGVGCVAGMAMTMFWQLAIISALSDSRPFYQFATHLAMRLQLHQFFEIPFDPRWAIVANLQLYSLVDVASAIGTALPQLTYGSPLAAWMVFAASPLAIAAALVLSPTATRPGCVIAAVVALSVPVWYVAFSNHTVLHSLYMIRIAVLVPLCAGVSLMLVFAPVSWTHPGKSLEDSEIRAH